MNTPEPHQPGTPAWPDAGPRTGDGSGDAGLSAALSVLGGLPDLPVAEHADVYDGLHEALLEALDADQEADAGADLMGPAVIDTTAGEA